MGSGSRAITRASKWERVGLVVIKFFSLLLAGLSADQELFYEDSFSDVSAGCLETSETFLQCCQQGR